MKKKILIFLIIIIPAITNAVVFPPREVSDTSNIQQYTSNSADFGSTLIKINNLFLSPIYKIIISLVVILFAWNALMFIFSDSDKKASFKNRLMWSLVAVFILFSIWGIIILLQDSFPSLNRGQESFKFDPAYKIK